MSKSDRVDKEMVQDVIRLSKPLKLHKDPTLRLTSEGRKIIKNYEESVLRFYSDLKADGYITYEETFLLSNEAEAQSDRNNKFYKIATNVFTKLPKLKELEVREQWFILLPIYCWFSEMIKNLLLEETKRIYKSLEGKDWGKRFMTLGEFLKVMDGYKHGKHKRLFSELDVDLRNSVDHANFDFKDEITYQDNRGKKKSLKFEQMLSMSTNIALLNGMLSAYRTKVFRKEVISIAKLWIKERNKKRMQLRSRK